jgi:hypothetical protein
LEDDTEFYLKITGWGGMEGINLAQDNVKTVMKTIMNMKSLKLQQLQEAEDFLVS